MAQYAPKELDAIFAEIAGESDRAAILVSASLVEHHLGEFVISALREPQSSKEREAFISDDGLGLGSSFARKIWLAYFIRLIGSRTRRDLDLIRVIRNHVAHDMNPVSFLGTAEIKARCAELSLDGADTATGKQKFLIKTKMLAASFQACSISSMPEIVKQFRPFIDP